MSLRGQRPGGSRGLRQSFGQQSSSTVDLQANLLRGSWYYRVTAVDAQGRESAPSIAVVVRWPD